MLYDRIEAKALAAVFGDSLPTVRVHSTKSMLGQHGAGSSALQAVAACLSIRRGVAPPTINHEELDPECGPLRVVTEADPCKPKRVLTHAIGLGGFYYSCAAFAAPPPFDPAMTGEAHVKWSAGGHQRYKPTERFSRSTRLTAS